MKNKILVIGLILILGAMLLLLTGCGEQQPTVADAAGVAIYNAAQDTVDNNKLSQAEITAFDSAFESYEGEEVKGRFVKQLIDKVKQNNLINEDYADKQIELTGDVIQKTDVKETKTYEVKFNYDSNGLIDEVIITEN